VEVKIGVQDANRELVVESAQSREEVVSLLRSALVDADGVLELSDERGRTVLVPTAKLAYLELGEDSARRVGFANR
jgi:Mg2+/Co2+ transporter CorC